MNIARKEAGESQNHIRKAQAKKYITTERADKLVDRYETLIIGINNFKKYIYEKRDSNSRKGSKKT
jgi:four helix bundle protein